MAESSAQGAPEYLAEKNIKSLIEWVTAEVLFARPEDPLTFVQKIVSQKVQSRGAGKYNPSDNDKYLEESYDDATVSTAAASASSSSAAGAGDGREIVDEVLTRRLSLLEKVISASRAIAMELDPLAATEAIIRECCSMLEADRATLFRLDEDRKELELMVAEGAKSIYVPLGTGIAGTVGATGEIINIPDAYADSRFDSSYDKTSGYRTESILCAPVRDGEGKVVGVIQAINCKHGPFNDMDQEVITILASQAGIAMKNAQLYHESVLAREKVRSLLDIIKAMHDNIGINSLMFTITTRAHRMVDADRCTFFLASHHTKELWSMQGEVDIRIPMDKGIAGWVATNAKTLNIPDAYEDDRFNQAVDKASGYRTRSILCMPVVSTSSDRVVGVIQLINKESGPFDSDDEELMGSFLTMAAPILENSQLFQKLSSEKEPGNEFTGKVLTRHTSGGGLGKKAGSAGNMIIEEGDEEEEEEDDEDEAEESKA